MRFRTISNPPGKVNLNADGLAFVIVPNDKPFLLDSSGLYLGLFYESTYQNTMDQLAIEFDTIQNLFDPDDNHVSIDVKSIKSDVATNLEQHSINMK